MLIGQVLPQNQGPDVWQNAAVESDQDLEIDGDEEVDEAEEEEFYFNPRDRADEIAAEYDRLNRYDFSLKV